MPLTDDDVREILRLIDESEDLRELRVETEGLSLYVLRADVADESRPEEEREPEPAADRRLTIASPMIGTFYRAEAPGAAPFVSVGSRVEPDTVVCLIEVMKMMNSVPAGLRGTIVEVCAENAEPVEYGAPLFLVEPAA
jgi:acetyl-CoA carboxylase biotin carboxyl carrier protein